MSNFWGYVDLVAGEKTIANVGASGLSGLLIGNESGLTAQIELQNANSKRSLYPGTVDFFEIPKGTPFNGNVIITNDAKLSNVSSNPGSYLQIDTFGPGEKPNGTYPLSLYRNGNLGNQISVSNVAALVNTTNAPGSAWLTVQPTDAAASTWSADNSGNLLIQSDNAGTLQKMLQLIAGASPLMKIFDLIQMDTIGHIIMPNNITLRWLDSSGNSQAVLVATSADEVHLRATKAGGNVIVADSNDASIATFNSTTGMTLADGGVNFVVGSISRISIFNQAVTTSLTAYNHGLGVKPDAVIMQLLGTSTTAASGKYDDTSMNTTTVKMISSVNATYRVIAIAK